VGLEPPAERRQPRLQRLGFVEHLHGAVSLSARQRPPHGGRDRVGNDLLLGGSGRQLVDDEHATAISEACVDELPEALETLRRHV
jgi:hypothetical protein